MRKRKGFALIVLLVVALALGVIGIGGYVRNIIGLTKCDFEAPYKAEVIRAVGVVIPPVGMIVGWVGIEDITEIE